MHTRVLVFLFFFLSFASLAQNKELKLETFIEKAIKNDDSFQKILIDELLASYNKDLKLTSEALIASVKSQYGTSISDSDKGLNTTLSLEKLFRNTGTTISTSYNNLNYTTGAQGGKSLNLSISQDIAKNAFGRMQRKDTEILEIENDIIKYQLIEAYEDYLSKLIYTYLNFYMAYQNKLATETFFTNSEKQEKNIRARFSKNISDKIEVDKMTLQTLSKKENLIASKSAYSASLKKIKELMRDNSDTELKPAQITKYLEKNISFDENFKHFISASRTFKILNLIEKSSQKLVSYNMDNLFPSMQVLFDYSVSGSENIFNNSDKKSIYTGFKLSYPFWDSQKKAKLKTSQLEVKKMKLTIGEKKSDLKSKLFELYSKISETREKRELIKKKIAIAKNIFTEEEKSYNHGRSRINDLISSLNDLENYRFLFLAAEVELNKLIIEWLRLTDKLVKKIG